MKAIFLILLLVVICYSQESEIYLVYLEKIPAISLIEAKDVGIKTIQATGGQPFRITHWIQAPNTNYLLISIVPQNQTEINLLGNLVSNNYVSLISKGNVVCKQNRFGDIQVWEETKFNDLPDDFYDVVTSTP